MECRMPKLSSDFLKNAMPPPGGRLELRDDQERGLTFRVTAAGVRSWSLRYRNKAGEQRRKDLGKYPAVTLAGARAAARAVKVAVGRGDDPVAQERQTKAAEASKRLRTFQGLADAYFADAELGLHRPNARSAKRPTTLKEEKRIFDKLVAPEFGDTPIDDVKRGDIQAFVTKQSKKAASNGRHCRTVLRQLLSYAVWKELLDANPAHDIAVVASEPRDRTLTDAELKAFWSACTRPVDVKDLALSPEMGLALKLAAITLQRGGEVIGMRWAEIDARAKTWLIPSARMKGKRAHLVPLSQAAWDVIEEARSLIGGAEFVFETGRRGDDEAPASLDRRSFSRAMARIMAALKLPRATPHDLRRTGATAITSERIGIPRFIVSQVIAHSGDTGGAAAVTGRHYDLNDYLGEKRRALDAWGALLLEIVEGKPRAANVTPIGINSAG
jgi:integrase